jgi:hypothetical protein
MSEYAVSLDSTHTNNPPPFGEDSLEMQNEHKNLDLLL